jgi:hypothetical protein
LENFLSSATLVPLSLLPLQEAAGWIDEASSTRPAAAHNVVGSARWGHSSDDLHGGRHDELMLVHIHQQPLLPEEIRSKDRNLDGRLPTENSR